MTLNQSKPKNTKTLKILLVGDPGVGKTAFVHRYANDVFLSDYKATIGADFAQKYVEWPSSPVNVGLHLQMWDIAGQDRFASMTRVYYKDAHGAIVMCDLTNFRSFDGAIKWKLDIDATCQLFDGSPIPCMLLANKNDLRMRDMSQDRIEQLASQYNFIGWAECSVKQNVFIEDSVEFLVQHILQRLSAIDDLPSDDIGGRLSFNSEKLPPHCPDNLSFRLSGASDCPDRYKTTYCC